jgi:probable HAF family extracellular repeat protein
MQAAPKLFPSRAPKSLLALATLAALGLPAVPAAAQTTVTNAQTTIAYTLKDLGTLGATYTYGSGVNASGQVTGVSGTSGYTTHAFLSGPNGTGLKDLGTLGGTSSAGSGVNDTGQVVGYSDTTGDAAYHAFLYSGGSMFDLDSLIAPGTGFTLTRASGISDTGFITGIGTNSAGQDDAFLLTPAAPSAAPVPEGSTTLSLGLMLVLGLGTLALRARRRKAARQVG